MLPVKAGQILKGWMSLPCGDDEHRDAVQQIASAAQQHLGGFVQMTGIRAAFPQQWQTVRRKLIISCLHPRSVRSNGVDLAVMGNQAKRLGQPPGRMRIGRVPLMKNNKARFVVWILQVEIELSEVESGTKRLVNNRLRRKRGDIGIE